MDNRFFWFLVVLFTFCVFMAAAQAQERVEALGGLCKHRLAPDASWHYGVGNYETNMNLSPWCSQVGVKWKRWRVAYFNLGSIDANNTFPVNEQAYFNAKNTATAVQSNTGRFQGTGTNRGVTFGPIFERKYFGAEAGIAYLYNTWHVNGQDAQWHYADSWNTTYYLGVNARYQWLMVSLRRYGSVHASNADTNPLYVGPTSGPVTQVVMGLSIPLERVQWAN